MFSSNGKGNNYAVNGRLSVIARNRQRDKKPIVSRYYFAENPRNAKRFRKIPNH